MEKQLWSTVFKIMLSIIGVICLILWVFVLLGSFEFYYYRFPVVENWGQFLTIIITHLFPGLLIGTSVFCLFKGKKRKTLVCLLICILALICCFIVGLSYGLYRHPIISHTTDPANFGNYDASVDSMLRLNAPDCFPKVIPDNAQNVQYCYYYKNASAQTVYVAVCWELDLRYLNQQAEQMERNMLVESNGSQVIYRAQDDLGNNVIAFIKCLVLMDYDHNRICYVVTSDEILLPKTIDEAFEYRFSEDVVKSYTP